MKRIELKKILPIEKFKEMYTERGLSYKEMVVELNNKDILESNLRHLNTEEYHCHCNKQKLIERNKKLNLEKYGVEYSFQRNDIKEKIKQTNLQKYGVENPFANKDIKEKIKQTNLQKYGVENPMQSKKIQNKAEQTNINKYGVSYPGQSEVIKKKIQQTNIVRYGGICPAKSKDTIEKMKTTNLERYGVTCTLHNKEIEKKVKKTCLERYGNEYAIGSESLKSKIKQIFLQKYGVEVPCMLEQCRNAETGMHSKPNENFASLLELNKIEYSREFPLLTYSYDFKVDNKLIEIDPAATHNSTWGPHNHNGLSTDYHLKKSKVASDNKFQCIHIFEWDDPKKIINLLKKKNKIYARNCEIKEVSKKDTDNFLNEYHIQGTCNNQTYRYGLYYNDELVGLITFGKPRYNKKYKYELLRLCYHPKYNIIGGTFKLFNYFIKTNNPKTIVSYCDNSKFNGDIYHKLGFVLESDQICPSKHWYNIKMKKHITDNLLRQHGFDQLFNTNFGKGTSNEELMKTAGFVEIYDCGQSTWIWKK